MSTALSSTPISSSAAQKSSTLSSSSATPSPTAGPVQEYGIVSKPGTPLNSFKDFVHKLDGGKGSLHNLEALGQQIYLANINATQASNVSAHDFIQYTQLNTGYVDHSETSPDEFRATIPLQPGDTAHREFHRLPEVGNYFKKITSSFRYPRALLPPQSDAPWWKKTLSALPRAVTGPNTGPRNDPDYVTDDSGGKDSTIYILDDGFDLGITVRHSLERVYLLIYVGAQQLRSRRRVFHRRQRPGSTGSGEKKTRDPEDNWWWSIQRRISWDNV